MALPLRGCALVLTIALLVPWSAALTTPLPAGEAPVDPLLPPVVPVAPPVKPAPEKNVTATPATAAVKAPAAVPTDAAQAEVLKTLKAAFKEEFSARRKAEDRQAFARVLLEQGKTTSDDVERFVVLSEASAQAAKAGDLATVLTAQDVLAAKFAVNARESRLTALADLTPNLPSEEAANATLDAMLLLAEVGITKDDYPFTTRVCKEADALARRLSNPALNARVKSIADRAKFLGDEFKKVGTIEEDLLGTITPDSHLRLGQFLCFAKGDWKSGLPHLAEGSDIVLQAAATNELAASSKLTAAAESQPLPAPINAALNVDSFAPVAAKFLRFTVLATKSNDMPGIDELEVFASDGEKRNVALASAGTKATASSVIRGYEIHKIEHINDGKFGNNHSWISNENGAGWVRLEFTAVQNISKVAWARDRELKNVDRLATRYKIDVSTDGAQWTTVATSEDRQAKTAPAPNSPAAIGPDKEKSFAEAQQIADAWYEIGQKQRKTAKEEIQLHALMWYRRAAPGLTGPARLKLDKRVDELVRALEATGRSVRYPAGATLLLTFERETLLGQGTSVTHVLDTSGKNLRATATGPLSVESGSYGLAMKFDGKSWLFVSNSKDLQITGSHTIAFWMRPDLIGIRQNPFHKKYDSENSMVLEPEGYLNYLYGIGNAETYQVIGLTAAGVPKRWTHVAMVRDITSKRLTWFKNGKKANEAVMKHPASTASNEDQLIGNGYCSPFNGLLDDVGLWPRALSEAEIRQMYDATANGR